jgi:hypothetical protein
MRIDQEAVLPNVHSGQSVPDTSYLRLFTLYIDCSGPPRPAIAPHLVGDTLGQIFVLDPHVNRHKQEV